MNYENKDPSRIYVFNKNPPGKNVGIYRKKNLIDLYKNIIKNEPDLKFSKLARRLSQETGIGYITVKKTVREYLGGQPITQKIKQYGPPENEKIGTFEKCKILQKIHSFWLRQKIPTSKNILLAINADPGLPSLNFTSLEKVFKDLRIKYTRCIHQTRALTETEDIVLWRRKYIEDIRRYRNEGRTIYYLEETWVNVGGYSSKELWTDIESPRKGKQIIVVHIGSVEGFVEGGLLCFESKNDTSNYHDHMNEDIFYDWFCGILPLLKENSVIVFDNASHYKVKNHVPNTSWNKGCILKWFEGKGIKFDTPLKKVQLIEKVNEIRIIFDNYKRSVQEAINHNKAVLRLPPYHCQLSPMQLAWEVVINHVKIKNCTSSKLDDVHQLFNDGVKLVTTEMLAGYVNSSIAYEDKLWNLDIITDSILNSMIYQ
ncbi:uncharacterized protein LOC107884834 [Acyrthosiphon pisum]|uniref:Tc1-like transposase DDE domain-containing protein n=1 Tax=Acyrthosiphon pisum TaxID=7029 RepID=A0A8R2D652_ACYPI|nr:uncharacterized protein LOC107884834 [Acyrthosiphon pisum]|eukprot:XP_016663249.1 PREDICTED: uncharacterized protein LOC107884834 isoform X3 [Acyrthosiphon pisum]